MKIFAYLILCVSFAFSSALQDAINSASDYDVLELPKGTYKGNIVINKPLTIVASTKGAIIQGENKGSVITIESSYVTIKNLTIKQSGKNKQAYDSAIIASDVEQIEIAENTIEKSFNGITFVGVKDSIISNNKITGNQKSIVARGDAIFMYDGQNNTIKNNTIKKMRDLIVDYSYDNKIMNNNLDDMRYGIHAMNASGNIIEGNKVNDAIAGLYFMYNKNYIVKNNIVKNSKSTKGVGIGLIESEEFNIENNTIIYNTVGLMIDGSPESYESQNMFKNNRFIFNSEAIRFKQIMVNSAVPRGKNNFIGNDFDNNIVSIVDESNSKELASSATWSQNYWSDYKGLDEDKDLVGDIPYELYYYTDIVWMKYTDTKYFFNSIALGLRDFLGRIVPIRNPYRVLTDDNPKIKPGINITGDDYEK